MYFTPKLHNEMHLYLLFLSVFLKKPGGLEKKIFEF